MRFRHFASFPKLLSFFVTWDLEEISSRGDFDEIFDRRHFENFWSPKMTKSNNSISARKTILFFVLHFSELFAATAKFLDLENIFHFKLFRT